MKGISSSKKHFHDPHSIQPVKLAVVLVETQSRTKATYHRFVGGPQQTPAGEGLITSFQPQCPVCRLRLEICLLLLVAAWLAGTCTVWDGLVCEQALLLGRYHQKYAPNQGTGLAAHMSAKTWSKEQLAFQTSLMCACQRHGVPYQLPPQASNRRPV